MYAESNEFDSEMRWRQAVERQAIKRNFAYPWNIVEIEELSKCGLWTDLPELEETDFVEDLNSNSAENRELGDLESYLPIERDRVSLQDRSNAAQGYIEPSFYTPLKPVEIKKESGFSDKENLPFKSQLTPKLKRVIIPPLEVKPKSTSPQTAHVTTATFRNQEGIRESRILLNQALSTLQESSTFACTESVPLVNFDLQSRVLKTPSEKTIRTDDLSARKANYETDVKQLYAGLDQFLTGVNQIREELDSIQKAGKQKLRRIGSRS